MTLDNVIAAAFTLSRQDRRILFDTIAAADRLTATLSVPIDIHGPMPEQIAKLPFKHIERQKNHGKPYTPEELDALQQIIIKADTDMGYTKSDRLKEMRRIARQYGRDFEAVRNKIQKLRGGK